ncbi:histidine kinase [Weissella viridescens]|uniref:histidine kinase n=1 Tax=Weissella viridescens TaxID=1629 RepID=A0A3P2RF88_WEIVI|nr:ATP-binding protein [Weissella viridescens]RRG18296.1 histidine kinase [Weissella viridescens]
MNKHKIGPFIRSFGFFAVLFFFATSIATLFGNLISSKALAYGDLWELLLFVSVGLAFIVAIVLEWTRRRQQDQIDLFIEKMQAMRAQNAYGGKVLLRPDDPLAPLANAINDVQSLNRSRTKMLQQQASVLNVLLENMPIGVLRIKPNHEIVQMNDQAMYMLQLPDDVIGKPFENVFKSHQLLALVNQVIDDKVSLREQMQIDQLDVDVFVTYYQLRERHDEVMVLLYDMTELKRLQNMQADFAANASHELRTPLSAIIGFADTLLDGAQDDPDVRSEFIQIIHDQAEHLLDLTNDILTLAKTPVQNKAVAQLPIRDMVDETFATQANEIKKLQLTLHNKTDAHIIFQQNRDDVQTILTNLIVNAIKYNQMGGSVTVTAHADQRQCFITVSDTGMGIPSDQQERIFERFYRLDKSHNKKIPGTGLGLAIVNDLVQSLGGNIHLESQVGVGTKITVTIPNLPMDKRKSKE